MKIIVDAMGGDFAPKATVEGAILAAKEYQVEVILTGVEPEILAAAKALGHDTLPSGITVHHTAEVITMEDDPARVIREKKDSSMVVGLTMLRDGQADGFVSAGNTGALLSGATLITKRIRGVRRAALSPVIPNADGGAILIDCGANVECTPEYLVQFAYMGSFYAKRLLKRANPKVGILSNGTEEGKGAKLQQDTYALLKEAPGLNFIGNIEGRDVLQGGVDVVVTDGFTGNVLLKGIEGTAMFLMGELKSVYTRNALTKCAALLVKNGLRGLKGKLDVSEIGGTALLGIAKPVIKAHGNSDAKTIRSAIRQARDIAASGIVEDITEQIGSLKQGEES